jgi:methionyl-tRNA formyltransferase
MTRHTTDRRTRFGRIDRVLLLGSGPVLTSLAERLAPGSVQIVTGPRMRMAATHRDGATLEAWARQQNIPFAVSDDINTEPRLDEWLTPSTLGISLGAPWIFREPVIRRFGGRLINAHQAPLPRYRGGGGFSWQLMARNRSGGCAVHLITARVDDGPVLASRRYRLPVTCTTAAQLEAFASRHLLAALLGVVAAARRGASLPLMPQREAQSSYWPRLSTDLHGFVDWAWAAQEIVAFIRAFDAPYPGASSFLNGRRIRLRKARFGATGTFHPFQSGLVFRKVAGSWHVAARGGAVVLGEIATDGAEPVIPRLGDRLYTPQSVLERARQQRVTYTAAGLGTPRRSAGGAGQ